MKLIPERLFNLYERNKTRKYNNIVEASRWSIILRKLAGAAVVAIKIEPNNVVAIRFSNLGFLFFVIFNAIYLYCSYKSFTGDQTILRNLYNTKLKRYGDDFERIVSFIYVLFAVSVNPFKLSGNKVMVQKVFEVDKVIEDHGEIIDYNKISQRSFAVSFGQIAIYILRLLSIFICLNNNTNTTMPFEKMLQVVYCDAQALIITATFAFYMIILRDRLKILRKVLNCIKNRKAWEYRVFQRNKLPKNEVKISEMTERQICEKIRFCAIIYSMLCKACFELSCTFGYPLLMTMSLYVSYIVLYLFYFMEATATGLFHDVSKYIDFVVYTFWEIAVAVGIIILIVYFCELIMREVTNISYTVHEVINENISPSINNEVVEKLTNFFLVRNTYDNIVDASYSFLLMRKLAGASVLVISLRPGNVVVRKFCPLGFLLFVLWNSVYLFCVHKVFNDDLTIFERKLNSNIKGYGTGFETMNNLIFVTFAIIVTPFRVSGNRDCIQKILEIDKILNDSGENIDFNKISRTSLIFVLLSVIVYISNNIFCFILQNYKWFLSVERVIEITYTDLQAALVLMTFVYYLLILRERFNIIKQVLICIKEASHWKSNVYHQNEIPYNLAKVAQMNEQQICDKIRSCAKIYTMLCKSCCLLMTMIGLPLMMCMLVYLANVVLYIYYFIEAIAIGKLTNFSDHNNIIFLTMCVWAVPFTMGSMILVIYFCESIMKEVVCIKYVIHDISNENISQTINTEAMQFSMQLLHEKPVFMVLGMYHLNYELIYQGAKTVTTYLVILLQFATENQAEKM